MNKEKIYNLLLFILIFFAILSIILLKPLDNLDEIWNYNFASNIANGLIPYKDFNIVVTPLLSFVCGIILKITFNELLVMRILASILCSTIIYITYKMFKILGIKKETAVIYTFFVGYLFKDIFCIDYNYMSLLLTLIIIYKEIKLYKEDYIFIKVNLKEDIILGILAGLTITTKQTCGVLISIVLLGNKLLFVRGKVELKKYIKSFINRLIGISIPVIAMGVYLIINNAFFDFINYAILGVGEFNNSIAYKTLIKKSFVGFLSILVPITILYTWIKTIVLEKNKEIYILLVYGLAIFTLCFPISDKIHFFIGSLPIIIIIIYGMYSFIYKLFNNKIKKIRCFILLMLKYMTILFIIYYTILNLHDYFLKKESFSTLNHFSYIPIDTELENRIKNVDQYILENKDVKILDTTASIYMIPIDQYNKDYDMFNIGNFGADGEERLINQINYSKYTKYLILKEEFKKNWQTPLNIINNIKNSKTKIGQIEIFDIYEQK